MNDRELRDAIEWTQVDLRKARTALKVPLNVEALNAEIEAKLAALAPERDRLFQLIRGARGLRECVEEARLRADVEQSMREQSSARVEFIAYGFLVLAYGWGGVEIGQWLSRLGVPAAAGAVASVLSALRVFVDLRELVAWLRRSD